MIQSNQVFGLQLQQIINICQNWIPSSIQTCQTRPNRCGYFRPCEAHIDFFWIHNANKDNFIITKNIGLTLPNTFITHIWMPLLYLEYKHISSSIGNQRYMEQRKEKKRINNARTWYWHECEPVVQMLNTTCRIMWNNIRNRSYKCSTTLASRGNLMTLL